MFRSCGRKICRMLDSTSYDLNHMDHLSRFLGRFPPVFPHCSPSVTGLRSLRRRSPKRWHGCSSWRRQRYSRASSDTGRLLMFSMIMEFVARMGVVILVKPLRKFWRKGWGSRGTLEPSRYEPRTLRECSLLRNWPGVMKMENSPYCIGADTQRMEYSQAPQSSRGGAPIFLYHRPSQKKLPLPPESRHRKLGLAIGHRNDRPGWE